MLRDILLGVCFLLTRVQGSNANERTRSVQEPWTFMLSNFQFFFYMLLNIPAGRVVLADIWSTLAHCICAPVFPDASLTCLHGIMQPSCTCNVARECLTAVSSFLIVSAACSRKHRRRQREIHRKRIEECASLLFGNYYSEQAFCIPLDPDGHACGHEFESLFRMGKYICYKASFRETTAVTIGMQMQTENETLALFMNAGHESRSGLIKRHRSLIPRGLIPRVVSLV